MTTIRFSLKQPGSIHLSLYDETGREVQTMARGNFAAGYHSLDLDASKLASGWYVYKLYSAHYIASRTMTIVK